MMKERAEAAAKRTAMSMVGLALAATLGCTAGDRAATDEGEDFVEAVSASGAQTSGTFSCDPTAVTGTATLRKVDGAPGDQIVLKATGAPCRYHLLYQSSSGDSMLSHAPAMYLLSDARVVADAVHPKTTLVCASAIHHGAHRSKSKVAGQENRQITGVALDCAALRDGHWSQTNTVVSGGVEYAAWVIAVGADASDADRFKVRWVRDSTFQPFNMVDKGRPATDGVYETTFDLVQGRGPIASSTIKLSDRIVTASERPITR
jgi:hypothetical protein